MTEMGISTMVLAGGWFVAGSLWLALAAFAVCVLLPVYIIGYWTEEEYIEKSGWRFTASLFTSLGIGYLLDLGGIPVHHYLFDSWWGVVWMAIYFLIGSLWSRHRLGQFLSKLIATRDEVYVKFCNAIIAVRYDFTENQNPSNNPDADEVNSSSLFPRHRIARREFKPLFLSMEPYLDGKRFRVSEEMLPNWEYFYSMYGNQLMSSGLSATASHVAYSENKEHIALWFFFWPSSMFRNLVTIVRDICTMIIDHMQPLYRSIFVAHGKELEIARKPKAPEVETKQ